MEINDKVKVFLVERSSNVYIQDIDGNAVSFGSFEDFTKYTGGILPGKHLVDYEPDRGIFIDSEDPGVTPDDIPHSTYEIYISNVLLYQSRKADPYYGVTLEEAYTVKRIEIFSLGETKKCEAELNPRIGVNLDVPCLTARTNRQLIQEDFNNKLIGEVTITQDEKDEAKAYQKLTEFYRKMVDDVSKGIINVEKLNTVAEVEAFDVHTDVVWNVWTPPV